jgi:hypothetical protein
MANKERSFIYSIILYLGLCLYSYYYQKFEVPLLPKPTNDPDWIIRGIAYPASFVFNFILALLFYLILKLINLIRRLLAKNSS